eukprot:superscaffoldBa00008026_g23021
MDGTWGPPLCFPDFNSSCRRLLLPHFESSLLYTLLAFVSLLTVTLNLLVIISISHFQQLQTPTNTLLLSLAVSDLVVGLLVMPIEGLRYIERCWMLGRLMCALTPYVSYCMLSASLGHMVLISIDRYLAICDPLLYSSKVTLNRVKISICTLDLFFSFVGPCTVMVVLYMRVFVVAVSQMKVIQSQTTVTKMRAAPTAKRSERKAARTLGIVITVFLMCFCPYYYPALVGQDTSTSLSYFGVLSWVMLMNSCVNPLIYALLYPWFRKAIKLILTLRILQPHSQEAKIL